MSEIEFVVHLVELAGEEKEIVHLVGGADSFWIEMDRLPGVVADAVRFAERDCTISKTVSQFVSHTG